jgi:hypothetical protein
VAMTVMEMVAKLGLDDSDFKKGADGVGRSARTMGDHVKRGAFVAATAITGGLVVAAKTGRFGFLGDRQLLEPRRLEPDLSVIDWRAQRERLVAVARPVGI